MSCCPLYKTILLVLALPLVLAACASGQPANPANVCDMFDERHRWYRAAERSEQRWGVPVHVTMAFVHQESSFQSRARPPRRRLLGFIPWRRPSTARGYAQALDSTWREYQQSTGNRRAQRSNFADAVDFIGWYNANSVRRNQISAHDARNLYLAYHEGNAGFARGSYYNKPWLLDVADRVQANASRYSQQYGQCQRDLARPWWRRVLS